MNIFSLDDILALEKYSRINLINNISGLKSANLIGTKNSEGQSNLAIFNSVIHIGANPPLLGFMVRPLLVERHTYQNIRDTGNFTVNQVTQKIHQQAHLTSANFPSEISEFASCNLTETYLDGFQAPFVHESNIKIGLSFQEEKLIKANNTILIIGQIEKLIVPEKLIAADGDFNFEDVSGVGIGGLESYYAVRRIGRYTFARPNKAIEKY